MVDATGMLEPWLRGLQRRDRSITEDERQVLAGLINEAANVAKGQDLIREGDRPARSTLMVQGWSCRYIDLSDGRRQIVALHLPGDFIDLHSFPLHRMDHGVRTLTPAVVARVPHERLRRMTETHPHLTRLLWLSTLIDAAVMRQWLLGLGQRQALEHSAHLLCELYLRLKLVHLVDGLSFELPMTQGELGQALGISSVHVNRVIQELRGKGVVRWRGSSVEILDWPGLQALAGFDPAYLNLEDEPR